MGDGFEDLNVGSEGEGGGNWRVRVKLRMRMKMGTRESVRVGVRVKVEVLRALVFQSNSFRSIHSPHSQRILNPYISSLAVAVAVAPGLRLGLGYLL